VVWTSTLIKKVKKVHNAVSREMDIWFDNTIGGYIIEFVMTEWNHIVKQRGISSRDLEESFYTF
jgi:hypothetical protein